MRIPGVITILFYEYKGDTSIISDYQVKLFLPSDLIRNNWILEYFPEEICLKRWKKGDRLFYILNEDNIPCSFAWIKTGLEHFVGELNKVLVFPVEVNCIFHCITPEKHRGKGYYPSLIDKLARLENQYPSIIYTSASNIPSKKGILKGGFKLTYKILKTLSFIKVTNLKDSMISINVKRNN
jgi:hypothetical protein